MTPSSGGAQIRCRKDALALSTIHIVDCASRFGSADSAWCGVNDGLTAVRIWIVDAFATSEHTGNSACVIEPFVEWPEDSWLRSFASEYHRSEVAFLKYTSDPSRYSIRWFTPIAEVSMCGRATLAAAHVLFRELSESKNGGVLTFGSLSGDLYVTAALNDYESDFPRDDPKQISVSKGLAEALRAPPLEAWASRHCLCVVLKDEKSVRNCAPVFF